MKEIRITIQGEDVFKVVNDCQMEPTSLEFVKYEHGQSVSIFHNGNEITIGKNDLKKILEFLNN